MLSLTGVLNNRTPDFFPERAISLLERMCRAMLDRCCGKEKVYKVTWNSNVGLIYLLGWEDVGSSRSPNFSHIAWRMSRHPYGFNFILSTEVINIIVRCDADLKAAFKTKLPE